MSRFPDTKAARQPSKGAPRDAGFQDKSPIKGATPRSYETHPAKVGDKCSHLDRGTIPVTKKLGTN